jgi:hypothetical protein
MKTDPANTELVSIGEIAVANGTNVAEVARVCNYLRFRPDLSLNHVPYFNAAKATRVREAFETERAERDS